MPALPASFNRCMSSSFVLIVLCLVVLDVIVTLVNPLVLLSGTGFTEMNSNYIVSKVPAYIASERRSEIVMTGSSLFLQPAVHCDDMLAKKQTRYDRMYICDVIDTYSHCHYLEKKVSEHLKKPVSIANLATAGGLMSDQFTILRKCIASGKRPELLIADISPREFHDNNYPDLEKTPVYLGLRDYSSFYEIASKPASLKALSEAALGCVWGIFRQKQDYRELFTNFCAHITGHPSDLFQATADKQLLKAAQVNDLKEVSEEIRTMPRADRLRNLPSYRVMLLPTNFSLFEQQADYLRRYLELAKQNNIPVMLVKMPLMAENLEIVSPALLKKFNSTIVSLAQEYGATLVDPRTLTSFEPSDFEDSAHLDTKGGIKLFDALAQQAAQLMRSHKSK